MLQLAEDVFEARTDPEQLDVTEEVITKLQNIHPASLTEHIEGDGPVVWILMVPVTKLIMDRFLNLEITEKELYDLTDKGQSFEAIYLCSALVLPEYRNKGLARDTAVAALNQMRKDFPIKSLFMWPFSEGGKKLAESIAQLSGLELKIRK